MVSPEVHAAEWVGGYRGPTRQNYGATVRAWLQFCEDSHLDPWAVSRVHIEAWIGRMAPRRARHAATVVCGFYRDAHGKGITEHDLGWGVRRPRGGQGPSGTWATLPELERMRDIARAEGGDTFAIIAILMMCGARLAETLALDVEAVVTRDPLRIKFIRKNGYIDVLTMPPTVVEALGPLLESRSTGPLLRHNGKRMPDYQARAIVAAISEQAGTEQRLTPHSLRRSFVTACKTLGVPDKDIMAMTGHRDPSMVEYYDRARRQRDGAAGAILDQALRP